MRPITWFLLSAIFFCQSCVGKQTLNTPAPILTPTNVVTEEVLEMPTMPTPSILIDPMMQRDKVVSILVGDVFSVSVPQGFSNWKVDYSDSVIQLLTPVENMREPGPQGWIFQAVAVGQTDIRLTSSTAVCNDPQPCPSAPPVTYVFMVDVK